MAPAVLTSCQSTEHFVDDDGDGRLGPREGNSVHDGRDRTSIRAIHRVGQPNRGERHLSRERDAALAEKRDPVQGADHRELRPAGVALAFPRP